MIITLLVLTLLYLFYHNQRDYTSIFFSHDTVVTIKTDKNITEEIERRISDLSSVNDRFDNRSDIYNLNQTKKASCRPELIDMIQETEKLCLLYGRGVDIFSGNLSMLWHEALSHNTVPDADLIKKALPDRKLKNFSIMGDTITLHNNVSIDPGAVAKGYALDCIFPVCAENSPSYAIVSFGSSTLLYSPDSTHTFNVAVKSDSDTIAGTAVTGPCFVSTSGSYERFTQIGSEKYHHILDMETGYPSESGLVSVTVFCDSGIKSDFLSTLIFIEGKEKLKAHLDSDDYSIIAIDDEGNIHKSSDLVFCEDK